MSAQAVSVKMTPGEYLDWEQSQQQRHEYHDGEIVAMSGGSIDHALIITNLILELSRWLQDSACRVVSSVMRVHVPECNRYFYPDVALFCGEPHFANGLDDTIDNPELIIEVLSPTTEHLDRTLKMDCYGNLASLRAYLVVALSEPRIERYVKLSGTGKWELTPFAGEGDVIDLPQWGCELSLKNVYNRIEFGAA